MMIILSLFLYIFSDISGASISSDIHEHAHLTPTDPNSMARIGAKKIMQSTLSTDVCGDGQPVHVYIYATKEDFQNVCQMVGVHPAFGAADSNHGDLQYQIYELELENAGLRQKGGKYARGGGGKNDQCRREKKVIKRLKKQLRKRGESADRSFDDEYEAEHDIATEMEKIKKIAKLPAGRKYKHKLLQIAMTIQDSFDIMEDEPDDSIDVIRKEIKKLKGLAEHVPALGDIASNLERILDDIETEEEEEFSEDRDMQSSDDEDDTEGSDDEDYSQSDDDDDDDDDVTEGEYTEDEPDTSFDAEFNQQQTATIQKLKEIIGKGRVEADKLAPRGLEQIANRLDEILNRIEDEKDQYEKDPDNHRLSLDNEIQAIYAVIKDVTAHPDIVDALNGIIRDLRFVSMRNK